MIYTVVVAALSLLGAALPLRFRPGHAPLQLYLSVAAGALLGAGLFHMLPESSHHLHGSFGVPAVVGVLLVFFLQRYVAPHSHEVADGICEDMGHGDHEHHHHHEHISVTESGGLDRADPCGGAVAGNATHELIEDEPACCEHDHEVFCDHEHHLPSGPSLGGLIAILALSIHSFFDGVAIAAATGGGDGQPALQLSVFLSVLIHKPMDGLSVSVLLLHAGMQRSTLWAVQFAYAALVPIGGIAFNLTSGSVADPSPIIGFTLAFTGGTFLAIALTDLLPELHFHTHDRNKLSAALIFGIVVMWLTSLIGHGDGNHAHGKTQNGAPANEIKRHHEPDRQGESEHRH